MNENFDPVDRTFLFISPVYNIYKPEFLDATKEVSNDYSSYLCEEQGKQCENELYPIQQTYTFHHDKRLTDFTTFISRMSWELMVSQGYNLDNEQINLNAMWLQTHYKMSYMTQHTHNYNSHFIGFYVLESSKSSRLIFHDPRPGKVQINLPEADVKNVSEASIMVNFDLIPGMFIFTNSWLPHSFSKNIDDEPTKVIHFSMYFSPRQHMEEKKGPIII